MKKTIICNIPMREDIAKIAYTSDDLSLPVSKEAFRYPILSLLSQTASAEDEFKVILLVKKDDNDFYKRNVEDFKNELDESLKNSGAKANCVIIDTEFAEEKAVHEELMLRIIDKIDEGSHIMADITYGPKDLPIVLFAALSFVDHHLGCEVDHIVYSQGKFKNDKVVSAKICDMSPLYYLSYVSNTIKCDDPKRSKQMLKSLLSL